MGSQVRNKAKNDGYDSSNLMAGERGTGQINVEQ
jgi:hypothetical protein